jgi:hypothetical protein
LNPEESGGKKASTDGKTWDGQLSQLSTTGALFLASDFFTIRKWTIYS